MARTLLRIDIKLILPDEKNYPSNRWDRFESMATAYMTGALDQMLTREFERTTQNWSSGPQFIGVFSRPRNVMLQLVVDPKGPGKTKWMRVSGGVKGHAILPRGPWMLSFQRNYNPHTKPGGKWGGPGSRSGDWIQTSEVKKWPGIKPREFSLEIKKRKEREIQAAFEKILRTALH